MSGGFEHSGHGKDLSMYGFEDDTTYGFEDDTRAKHAMHYLGE